MVGRVAAMMVRLDPLEVRQNLVVREVRGRRVRTGAVRPQVRHG